MTSSPAAYRLAGDDLEEDLHHVEPAPAGLAGSARRTRSSSSPVPATSGWQGWMRRRSNGRCAIGPVSVQSFDTQFWTLLLGVVACGAPVESDTLVDVSHS